MDDAEKFVRDAMSYFGLDRQDEGRPSRLHAALAYVRERLARWRPHDDDGDVPIGVRTPAPKQPPSLSAAVRLSEDD